MSFIHNIGAKPGDPAADVLFAFAFYCFHTQLPKALQDANLAAPVPLAGKGLLPSDEDPEETDVTMQDFALNGRQQRREGQGGCPGGRL